MEKMIFPEIFQNLDVNAFFTDKTTGIDKENISLITGKEASKVYLPIQKHTDKVIILSDDLTPRAGDAVITKRNDVLIGVQTADCVPVLLYDKRRDIFSAVHAGWRGTAKGILKTVITIFLEDFSSAPGDMLMAIGPSIRSCCYSVGYEVVKEMKKVAMESDHYIYRQDHWFIDLPMVNRTQALSLGINEKNIWMSYECTSCLSQRFYSYRHEKVRERQGGFIGMGHR